MAGKPLRPQWFERRLELVTLVEDDGAFGGDRRVLDPSLLVLVLVASPSMMTIEAQGVTRRFRSLRPSTVANQNAAPATANATGAACALPSARALARTQ